MRLIIEGNEAKVKKISKELRLRLKRDSLNHKLEEKQIEKPKAKTIRKSKAKTE